MCATGRHEAQFPVGRARLATLPTHSTIGARHPTLGATYSHVVSTPPRSPVTLFGLAVVVATVLAALLAPQLAPYPPDEQFFDGLTLEGAPLPPNARFWLGTDLLGRDLLSRLI